MRHLGHEHLRIGVVARDVARVWSTVKLKAYTQCRQFGKAPFNSTRFRAFCLRCGITGPSRWLWTWCYFWPTRTLRRLLAHLPAVWRRLVTGNLDVVHLKIDHDRLLDEPSATSVASMIEERFELAAADRAVRSRAILHSSRGTTVREEKHADTSR